jgi:hypothetical protein
MIHHRGRMNDYIALNHLQAAIAAVMAVQQRVCIMSIIIIIILIRDLWCVGDNGVIN